MATSVGTLLAVTNDCSWSAMFNGVAQLQLAIHRFCQFHERVTRHRPGQRIAKALVDPVKTLYWTVSVKMEAGFTDVSASPGLVHGAEIKRDAGSGRILEHELRPRTGFTWQQASAHELITLLSQMRHLERLANALGKPLHQVLLLRCSYLDRVPLFRGVHRVCKAGLSREIRRPRCSRQGGGGLPLTLPGRVGEPAHAKRQHYPGGHATPAPPLVDVLLRGRGLLRRCHQRGGYRLA